MFNQLRIYTYSIEVRMLLALLSIVTAILTKLQGPYCLGLGVASYPTPYACPISKSSLCLSCLVIPKINLSILAPVLPAASLTESPNPRVKFVA